MLTAPSLEIDYGIDRSLQAITDGQYLSYGTALAQRIQSGATNLMEVLAVKVAFDTTFDVLEHTQGKLPQEIDTRASYVASCAMQVVFAGTQCDLFLKACEASPDLDPLLTRDDVGYLTNNRYLIGHTTPGIFDSAKLVGGALRKLRQTKLQTVEPAATTIKRSTGLLLVNRIARELSSGAWEALGSPYVADEFLTVDDSRQPEVKFSAEARSIIMDNTKPGSGCPAAILGSPDSQGTILSDAWGQLVDYYLQPDATADVTSRLPQRVDHTPRADLAHDE